ncbi:MULTISPECIES: HdeD family acid-resistance protein [Microbacterium]|jgi:uncharacterized membrane protein HdeD (DUF308 family)|uniref:HdeD family acid-resistance protein n=1 Tax=Microbacterium TaxID=33882 RepID=UPI0006F66FC2|nr:MULTISPECIES: DUF308 domain-containing protein [unclassified Microbacterium]MBN9197486.1 DUF308 domain-containing protein [Microbacterium ginsengisoli]MCK9914213.1 DUF308 domain-containing protein [Microbacteriaceae bacterium K1510]KQR93160.1 hypothetical protein ASG00_02880 [Microbacterium sp. Leaf351]KQS05445.1 hypothetical protein ASF93_00335 [Microbacterium sp. Leaf347]ODU76366.1 MAG: hypothetical protein ABT08_09560 [Microbacterium sp. SCN 71-21]
MTTAPTPADTAVNGIRTALGIGGVVALIVGILILVWPLKTASVGTVIIAIYAIVSGLVYLGLGIFSKVRGLWSRIGHILLGIVFIAAGIVAFSNLTSATIFLAVFVGVFVGITWIVEGVVALTTLDGSSGRGWTIFYAIVSLLAGITLLFSPAIGAAFLWIFVGASLLVLGIVQIIRAFTFGKSA